MGSSSNSILPLPLPVRGEVSFDNVGFRYNKDTQVLHQISLTAQPGEMIALVGPTGAGKSTLVNLLNASYELTSGEITIDGNDISQVSLSSLREQISGTKVQSHERSIMERVFQDRIHGPRPVAGGSAHFGPRLFDRSLTPFAPADLADVNRD